MRRLRRFSRNWQNWLALAMIGSFVVVAAAAPLLAPPQDPEDPAVFKVVGSPYDRIPHPPTRETPLGTLPGQLDILYTLIWGTRHALRFGLLVSLSTCCIGVLVGATSGYVGGRIGSLTMRITDAFLAFPMMAGVGVLQQVIIVADATGVTAWAQGIIEFFGSDHVLLGLILFSWMPYARIINSSVIRLRQVEYVTAAVSIGVRRRRIIFRHLLPNVIAPAIVLAARDVGAMVLLGAAFTFIGIGGDSPWGVLVTTGRHFVIGAYGDPLDSWWVYLPVTVVLVVFGVGWNLLGDALTTLLDPQATLQRRRM